MFERFTEQARRVLFFARYEASQLGAPFIEPEHLVLGLLREGDRPPINQILERAKASIEGIRRDVSARLPALKKTTTSTDVPFSADLKLVLECAIHEAERLSHAEIGLGHLLLGILSSERLPVSAILSAHGLSSKTVRSNIIELGSGSTSQGRDADQTSHLTQPRSPGRDEQGAGSGHATQVKPIRDATGGSQATWAKVNFSLGASLLTFPLLCPCCSEIADGSVELRASKSLGGYRFDKTQGVPYCSACKAHALGSLADHALALVGLVSFVAAVFLGLSAWDNPTLVSVLKPIGVVAGAVLVTLLIGGKLIEKRKARMRPSCTEYKLAVSMSIDVGSLPGSPQLRVVSATFGFTNKQYAEMFRECNRELLERRDW